MSRLFCNIDADCFFHTPLDGREGNTGEAVDKYVDRLAEAGVKVLLVNTNGRRTNYRSAAWDAAWDGYDPAGPDTQPFLAALPPEGIQPYRRVLDYMLALHNAGVDYPARMLTGARRHGMSAWISLRMNDIHDGKNRSHPFHGRFWREHPEYGRQNCGDTQAATALDYARPEVRGFFRALADESLARYDIDGLELDFMREPKLFSRDGEAEGGRILTAWMGEIRQAARAAAARLGHAVQLGVRVPSNPDTAARMGLDAVAWARAGLVDVVVPTPRWASTEFDMPMRDWRARLAGTGVTLAGGLEVLVRASDKAPLAYATPEHATGASVAVLAGGADAVYLFNYFPSQHPKWPTADYVSTLRAMNSLPDLLQRPRRHSVTFRDILAPGEAYQPPLPAEGAALEFRLPTGPKPKADWRATLEIGLESGANGDAPQATVNGQACRLLPDRIESHAAPTVFSYDVPVAALAGVSANRIAVAARGVTRIKVMHVEMRLAR
jgi:hypothetical protein